MHTFPTIAAALSAGYRRPSPGIHRDTSGPGSYGYEFERWDGERTVLVRLTDEPDKLGRPGCYLAMFPPQ